MTFSEYQSFAKQNHRPGCNDAVFALGLGGETGEVLEIIKKAKRDLVEPDIPHLKEELGDVLWYVANLCTVFGLTLDEVVDFNVQKLCERYAEPTNYIEHASGDYSYRMNGPHIEKIDAATGKHVKFCGKKEVPPYILERLSQRTTSVPQKQEENKKPVEMVGGYNCDESECPF